MSRIVIKLSGEALKDGNDLVASTNLEKVVKIIKMLKDKHQIAIVVGGGNYFRGKEHPEFAKITGDTIGMLGTVINALYIKNILDKNNISCNIDTPFSFPNLISKVDNIKELYDKGNIIIFGGGVGKSGYSTDSGVILASEKVDADLIIKLTNVDGVYDKDPKIFKDAQKFDYLTYDEILNKNLKIMDTYAIKECAKRKIKILVMNFQSYEKIKDYFQGQLIGTVIGV